jgi:DNA-binding MurR/RpiR family transcriptional regulator
MGGSQRTETVAELEKRIQSVFPTLSGQLQQAARFVLDRREDVALLSMRELARQAGVQPTTMVRLANRLGFPNFKSFRAPFRERLRRHSSAPFVARARKLQAHSNSGATAKLIDECLACDLENLQRSFAAIDPASFEACAATIVGARRVYIVARRSCYPVAFSFFYAYRLFRDNAVLLDDRAGLFEGELATIGPNDALIAISFDPYTRETVAAASYALRAGAAVIAITDSAVSPLARGARHTLMVATSGPVLFQSIVAAQSLAQAIIALLVARGGQRALTAIAAREADFRRHNAYWTDKKSRRSSA